MTTGALDATKNGATHGAPGRHAPAISIDSLRKVYPGSPPVVALDGIDLAVEAGETFGLLGPNGAGKTTTVGIATTRVRPDAGTVAVAGVDAVRHPAEAKRNIGVVTQFNTLDRSLTVAENLYYHCRYYAMGARAAAQRTRELLAQFQLTDKTRAKPVTLSGGLAQRVLVARSIAHRPSVLFLDEPTAGLDPQSRLALWETIGTLKETGVTVLLTTHYMEEADALCDRVAIIDYGRILALGTPAELRRSVGAATVIELTLGDAGSGGAAPGMSAARETAPAHATGALAATLGTLPGVERIEPTATGLRLFTASAQGLAVAVAEAALPYGLRDLSITEPTLENVFIHLTGRELRD